MRKFTCFEIDNMAAAYQRAKEINKLALMPLELYVFSACNGSRRLAAAAIGVSGACVSHWLNGTGPRDVYGKNQTRLIARSIDPYSIRRVWESRRGRAGGLARARSVSPTVPLTVELW